MHAVKIGYKGRKILRKSYRSVGVGNDFRIAIQITNIQRLRYLGHILSRKLVDVSGGEVEAPEGKKVLGNMFKLMIMSFKNLDIVCLFINYRENKIQLNWGAMFAQSPSLLSYTCCDPRVDWYKTKTLRLVGVF